MRMTTDDGRRTTEGGRIPRLFPAVGPRSSVLCLLVLLAGCENRALDEAQQEAREAKATISRLNLNLTAAQNEIATIKAELKAVRQNRDDLQKLVDQLARDRDQASTFARDAQEAITRLTTRESSATSTTAALQKQVDDMKILIEEQRKLIEQLHKDTPVEPVDATRQPAPPTEPNESL